MQNFGTDRWLINPDHRTVLPFALDLYAQIVPIQPPAGSIVLRTRLDQSMPRYTDKLERTLQQYTALMAQSFKPPPSFLIDGVQYGPSYIKPIDRDDVNASVIYYSYQGVPIPGLSNGIDGDGNSPVQLIGDPGHPLVPVEWRQFINLIVIRNDVNARMNFQREKLMDTLKRIFNTSGHPLCSEHDTSDYVRTSWGVAFSGGFFKHINHVNGNNYRHCNQLNEAEKVAANCFKPVGYVRNLPIDPAPVYTELPAQYRDVYGSVCINDLDDSFSIIQPVIENDAPDDCGYVLASGAVLVEGGVNRFPANLIQERRFQARIGLNQPPREEYEYTIIDNRPTVRYPQPPNGYVPTNGQDQVVYLAGWLNHAFNLNPRAALGIDADGNILLVTVEGRGQRGSGCDLTILGQIMLAFGCVSAINLDGGGTADLLYKLPNSTCYVETNPVHMYKYPSMSLNNSSSFMFKGPIDVPRGGRKKTNKTKRMRNKKNIRMFTKHHGRKPRSNNKTKRMKNNKNKK